MNSLRLTSGHEMNLQYHRHVNIKMLNTEIRPN